MCVLPRLFAVFFACAGLLAAQTEQPKISRDDLPPSAIISSSVTSFDRVRSDMANWSDVELAAFQTMTAQAKADCARIEQTPHEGEEALALARLCALGMDWDGTYSAARWYTRKSAPEGEAQHLPLGFALLLQADLNLQAVTRAVDDLNEMQGRLPFTADTDSVFTYAISAMEVTRPEYALAAARVRDAALLEAVAGKNANVSPGAAEAEAWHTLALLRAAHLGDERSRLETQLNAAIASRTAPLSVPDQYLAQRGQTQYGWLGRPLPPYHVLRTTYAPAARRQVAAQPKAFLLVIEGADGADVPALSLAVDSLRARSGPAVQARLVLVRQAAPVSAKPLPGSPELHAEFTQDDLPQQFAAGPGPCFVVLDAQRKIVWLGTGTAAWLNPQQQAEILLARASAAEPPQ